MAEELKQDNSDGKMKFKKLAIGGNATHYEIIVNNKSGANQMVALYQTDPTHQFKPLVWKQAGIANGGKGVYMWEVQWGLSWGESTAPLADGVQFIGKGRVINLDPSSKQNNAVKITYDSNNKVWNVAAAENDALANGYLGAKTDTSFSIPEAKAKNFCIDVTMQGEPVLAISGQPNAEYTFETHPKYWLAITQEKVGFAVTGTATGVATEVTFDNGVYNAEMFIDIDGVIKPVK
eukprot:429135_1